VARLRPAPFCRSGATRARRRFTARHDRGMDPAILVMVCATGFAGVMLLAATRQVSWW
jgi:hypothetical protein